MKFTFSWLKDHLNTSANVNEIVDCLNKIGLEVSSLKTYKTDINKLKVAKILDVHKHPNADKLRVCEVNDGKELHTVVCGAPNAVAGKVVPFATVGALLPNDFKIKKAKIRGVESHGMLCAQNELGLSLIHI